MEKYYIWLLMAFGEGEPEIMKLIKRFETAEKAYRAIEKNVSLVGAELLSRAESTDLAKAEKLLDKMLSSGYGIITWESKLYPEHLRRTDDPPCVLFTLGDMSLLQKTLITVVGSRAVTPPTEAAIPRIIERLGREYAIVGTLSEGCDQLTCLNALKAGIPFIEILPCGFSQTYPAGSRSLRKFMVSCGGLIVSEHLPRTKAGQGTFVRRSRILGGISQVTLVLQAGDKSGALLTAEHSSAPLFLPPNDIFRAEYAGAVNAVRNGARLYLSAKSIEKAFARAKAKEEETNGKTAQKVKFRKTKAVPKADKSAAKQPAGPAAKEKAPSAESAEKVRKDITFETEEQSAIYAAIASSAAPVGVEELIAKTGFSADTLAEALLDLEIAGAVRSSGNRYSI